MSSDSIHVTRFANCKLPRKFCLLIFLWTELCWCAYKLCVTQVHDSPWFYAGQFYWFDVATEWLLQRYGAFFCWIKFDGAEMCQAGAGDGDACSGNRDVAVVF